jgi:hypothetical protein
LQLHLTVLHCAQAAACSRGALPRQPGTLHEQAPVAKPGARQPAAAQHDPAPAIAHRLLPAGMHTSIIINASSEHSTHCPILCRKFRPHELTGVDS